MEILRKENLEALAPIYNQILRTASGALRTSPILPLAVESGCLPFHHRAVLSLIRKACSVLEKVPNECNSLWEKANTAFQQLTGKSLPKLEKLITVHNRPWHKQNPSIDWTIKAKVRAGQIPQLAVEAFRELADQKYQQHNQWYTDGSLADGRVGFGVIGPTTRIEAGLPEQCSVFTAEAAALLQATREANGKSVIFSDSASCLQALEAGKSRNPYIQAIEKEAEGKDVCYCWIPGHSKIAGNEEADAAANNGRQREKATNTVPAQDIIGWSKGEIWKTHQSAWDESDRKITRIVKTTVHGWVDQKDRRDQIVLTRLRLGHTWLTKHHLFERKPQEVCDICNRNQTVHHILIGCQQFNTQRREAGFDDDVEFVLRNDREAEVKVICYLKKIGMYKKI